jgi:hypothetical protein
MTSKGSPAAKPTAVASIARRFMGLSSLRQVAGVQHSDHDNSLDLNARRARSREKACPNPEEL